MIKLKWLTGDVNYLDYGGKWITAKSFQDGKHKVWGVVRLDPDVEGVEEKYVVSVSAVSPSQYEDVENAMSSWDLEDPWDELEPEFQVKVIHSYDGGAPIAELYGNNFNKLMKEARQALEDYFGSYKTRVNKPVNKLMANGKDFLKGNRGPSPARLGKALAGNAYENEVVEAIAIGMVMREYPVDPYEGIREDLKPSRQ